MAAVRPRDGGTPPPVIGKAGRYTVFITPPATPKPSETKKTPNSPVTTPDQAQSPQLAVSPSSKSPPLAPLPMTPPVNLPVQAPPAAAPVQVPPLQVDELKGKPVAAGGVFGFFWDAVARVRDAHSSLDEYLADWFGLNQSKYQWALNDYYESKGADKDVGKLKEVGKGQSL